MIKQLKNFAFLGAILGFSLTNVPAVAAIEIPQDASVSSLLALAKSARARSANSDAIDYLNAAVAKSPSDHHSLYQRGLTYLFVGKTPQAKADFDAVLRIKPEFEAALLQRGKIEARNGNWPLARGDYLAAGKIGGKGVEELMELEEAEGAAYLAAEAEQKQDWETCVNQANTAIMTATLALSLRQLRAKCRLEMGEVEMAVSDLQHVLQLSSGSVEPYLQISTMLFYGLGDTEKGLSQIRKCLHSDPDSKPCKALLREEKSIVKTMEKFNSLLASSSFNSAVKLLVPAKDGSEQGLLEDIKANVAAHRESNYIHPKAGSQLYANYVEKACQCYYSLSSKSGMNKYCLEALQLNSASLYGSLHQAQQHLDAGNYDAAIATLNTAKDNHPDASQTINDKLHAAHLALKKSKQKDYYAVLGVSRDADDRTVKKAYRTMTKQHHPDKAVGRGVSKEDAEKKMASINEAYEVLSDPELKARYDSGEDPNDPMAQQGGNPFQGSPFGFPGGGQQFFFQQGGGPGGGGGGGGQRQFKFSTGGQQGGMPFGFPGFG